MEILLQIPESLEKDFAGIPDQQRQDFVVDAIRERLARDKAGHEAWIAEEIQKGVDEADRGEFVSDEEMKQFFVECGVNVKN